MLLDLPKAVVRGGLRVARLPFDLVFGRSPESREADSPRDETIESQREKEQQAEALRKAVKPTDGKERKADPGVS